MKKFNKNWIKMNKDSDDQVSEKVTEFKKEEKKMGFFGKYKGIIIGGLSGLAALAAGILIAVNMSSDGIEGPVDFDDIDDAEFKDLVYSE